MDIIMDHFVDFTKWLSQQFIIYSDEEFYAAICLQRKFREKMYRRRCKYTQTNITTIDKNVQVNDETYSSSSWHIF